MNVSNQIKEIAKHKDITITELSNMLGTSQANFANKLVRDKFRIKELQEILSVLGYTHIEIIARGTKEDAVILPDKVEYKKHNMYMAFNKKPSLLENIKEGMIRDNIQFKYIVLDLLEPYLKPKFGDLWDTYIPPEFEDGFKSVINKQLSFEEFAETLYGTSDKED